MFFLVVLKGRFFHFQEFINPVFQKTQIEKAREKPPTLRWFQFVYKVQKLRDSDRLVRLNIFSMNILSIVTKQH